MVALITQENIEDFMIEGDNAALMVERVSVLWSSLPVYKLSYSAYIFFHWLLSWLLHKWREGYLLFSELKLVTDNLFIYSAYIYNHSTVGGSREPRT